MMDYTGIKCPVCEVPFQQGDDIVVCPECGAPYHRECYRKEGQCVFQEEHAQGKVWEAPAPPVAPNADAEIKDRECPNCGVLNAHSSLFCNRCGASLVGEPQRYVNTGAGPKEGTEDVPPPYPPVSGAGPFPFGGFAPPMAFDPMGGVSPAEVLDEGVTFGDASKLVRQNTGYYMSVFRIIKNTKRNKFNFSAFLFSGPWMLYRKQYKWGSLVTVLIFALYLGYIFTNYLVASPTLYALMTQVGMDVTKGFTPNSDQMAAITKLLMESPALYLKISLPLILLLCMLVVMIVVGIRANKMYMKHCVRTVREIKASPQASDIGIAMESKGGVNVGIAICLLVCYILIYNIPLVVNLF